MSYGSSGRYREMEVMAMSPAQRVVLLYTHLLVSLKQAQGHFEKGEIEMRAERLDHAGEIIHELLCALDRKQGGPLAERLTELYEWMLTELLGVHAKSDLNRLKKLTDIVAELHAAWDGAAQQVAAQTPMLAAS